MAKKKRLPKRPKKSSPLSVWERYKDRVSAVKAYNKKLEADEAKKKKIIESTRK